MFIMYASKQRKRESIWKKCIEYNNVVPNLVAIVLAVFNFL